MSNNFMRNIVAILNSNISAKEKEEKLWCERARRRGENRIIILILRELLYQYALPLKFEDNWYIESLKQLSDTGYDSLLEISNDCLDNYIRAACLDLCWSHHKKITYATQALDNYFLALRNESNDYRFAAIVSAICRIYSKIKTDNFDFEGFRAFCIASFSSTLSKTNWLLCVAIRSLMLCSNSKELESTVVQIIDCKSMSNQYQEAISLATVLVEIYNAENRKEEKNKWLCQIAQYHEHFAETLDWGNPQNARRIVHLVQNAMRFWNLSKHPQAKFERRRLAKKIEKVKKLSLSTFTPISAGDIDLTEMVNHIANFVNGASFETCLWHFAHCISLTNEAELKEEYLQKGSSLADLFAKSVLDSEGRIICVIPPLRNATETEEKAFWENKASEAYFMYSQVILWNYLYIMRDKCAFDEEKLAFIVESNAFVPENRKQAFLKGIVSGFNLDFISALSILMPQVENAIRQLAIECGAVVFVTETNGVEKCLSMDSVLSLPEIEESLDPTLLFNLKVFYTSKYGFGMRNLVSHGLISDNEFFAFRALAVWWFTLYICCNFSPELIKRVTQQKREETLPI